MNVDTISDFLAEQRDRTPEDLQPLVLEFESFWERKLWHQLTDALDEFFNHPGSAPQRLEFYKVFILKFADKINQLKLASLGLKAAEQCRDDQERLSFLQDLVKKVDSEDSQDAFVYATVALAFTKLRVNDLEGARKDLDNAEKILDSFDSVETKVHASFYECNAQYYEAKKDYAAFYRTSLLYLACIDIKTMSEDQQMQEAHDLGVAALVSDSIYNFGELLQHPILAALKGQLSWLRDLLLAFNRGDLAAYDTLSGHISSNKLLKDHAENIRQKIYLTALTEAVFRRPPHERAMTFSDISADTKVAPNEIEHMVMKALSLGLVRGTIDEVDEVVNFTWVQPRVLDMAQIASMSARLGEWGQNVNTLGNWIESTGQDIWAA